MTFDFDKVMAYARRSIRGSFDEETDREQATIDYVNSLTNVELLQLVQHALEP